MEAQPPPDASVARGPWKTRYEDLRRHVLDGHAANGRWGLALFIRQGLVAWMQAWPGCSPAGSASADPMPRRIADRPSLPSNLRSQITSVLVNMLLGDQRRVFA